MAKKKVMEFEDEIVETEATEKKAKKSIKKEVSAACTEADFSSIMKQPPSEVIKPIDITCVSCGEVFTMSPAEQKLYKARGSPSVAPSAELRSTAWLRLSVLTAVLSSISGMPRWSTSRPTICRCLSGVLSAELSRESATTDSEVN